MLEKLVEGDIVIVTEVSRLGSNTIDVLTNVERFEKMKVKVVVLAYGSLDLTSDIGKLVITLAAALANMELSDLKRRTRAGMVRTKEAGTKLGRSLVMTPETFESVLKDKRSGVSVEFIAKKHNIHKNTINNNLKKWNCPVVYRQEWDARQVQYAVRDAKLLQRGVKL
jgi:DNA invertase Pin-like site-specific DNA recombinase